MTCPTCGGTILAPARTGTPRGTCACPRSGLMTQPIAALPIGARFTLPGLSKTGTLMAVTPTGATVEYDGGQPREATTRWGDEFTVPARKERCTISSQTEVQPLPSQEA